MTILLEKMKEISKTQLGTNLDDVDLESNTNKPKGSLIGSL